jgi:O-methyltransferase
MEDVIAKVKVKLNRFKKYMHPYEIRKKITYISARTSKHVSISVRLAEYIEKLITKGERVSDLYEMKVLEAGERSYLQVPFAEARFLEVFTKAIGAKNVLEIGTFCGFSTAFFARAIPEGGIVFSCDEDRRYEEKARYFWKQLGVDTKIHFELGEAVGVLKKLTEDKPSLEFFDLVFIDANKENYRQYVQLSWKLLRKGGSILIDNTLWKGLVQYTESRDNSAEHMQKFNEWLFTTYGTDVSIVPAWDGLTLVTKR